MQSGGPGGDRANVLGEIEGMIRQNPLLSVIAAAVGYSGRAYGTDQAEDPQSPTR